MNDPNSIGLAIQYNAQKDIERQGVVEIAVHNQNAPLIDSHSNVNMWNADDHDSTL